MKRTGWASVTLSVYCKRWGFELPETVMPAILECIASTGYKKNQNVWGSSTLNGDF